MKTFTEKVFAVVAKIPKGKVLTYKEVAERAGSPRASRAVGSILKTNYNPRIPCHRVIRSDGKTGHYNRGDMQKIALLKKEGALSEVQPRYNLARNED
ncbi:MAG: MGMT family protein [Candidatus Pacebacteria bacterium]|nr:MGMT family protein [Candidatus Paceibacterota bacterium]MDD5357177.1 MGMT family protein [Candidatus Paceibacterota bacterium]